MLPVQCRAIIWTNVGLVLKGHFGTNFSELQVIIPQHWYKKINLNFRLQNVAILLRDWICGRPAASLHCGKDSKCTTRSPIVIRLIQHLAGTGSLGMRLTWIPCYVMWDTSWYSRHQTENKVFLILCTNVLEEVLDCCDYVNHNCDTTWLYHKMRRLFTHTCERDILIAATNLM